MAYTPHRSNRYMYIWEVAQDIEENQCRNCVFSKLFDADVSRNTAEEFPMCFEIEGLLIQEIEVPQLSEKNDGRVVCTEQRKV